MTPAEHARNAAISFECKKDALQQRQSGDWKISFTVQGTDMDQRITRAPMGTRFVAVLVEINDQELPVTPAEKESNRVTPQLSSPHSAGAKRDWRDMQPAQQAGIRCGEPIFQAFLKETRPDVWREAASPAECVRLICGVTSRVQLGTNQKARMIWHQLDEAFQAWRAMEHA